MSSSCGVADLFGLFVDFCSVGILTPRGATMKFMARFEQVDPEHERQGDDADQVDVSLIDEMLRLSPLERLRHNDRMRETVVRLREAFARITAGSDS